MKKTIIILLLLIFITGCIPEETPSDVKTISNIQIIPSKDEAPEKEVPKEETLPTEDPKQETPQVAVVQSTCTESDFKDIWGKGTCTQDGTKTKDRCDEDFEDILLEFNCLGGRCVQEEIDCSLFYAKCYQGRCIRENEDSDGDGFTDLEEYRDRTDPNDKNDNMGVVEETPVPDCNTHCVELGQLSGRDPEDSGVACTGTEIEISAAGPITGDMCCCTPPISYSCSDSDSGKDTETVGICESSFDNTGYTDSCESEQVIKEYYCDDENKCVSEIIECETEGVCFEGHCGVRVYTIM